ncbi:MAG TPA: hypothetical protein DCF68_14495 [Cyanothece sp. UBA12306]|nr:hypothetical protein [Cyanothece sp. UBA12306]
MKTSPIPVKIPLVLVVDDDRAMRGLLKVAIEAQGYGVIDAKNGEECLEKYVQFKPDMILLDAIMPEMDGFSCCKRLRSFPDTSHLPILMITALDDQESIDKAFEVGATDYITKPIYWTVLSQRVKYLLYSSQALRELDRFKLQIERQQQWQQLNQYIAQNLRQPLELKSLLTESLAKLRTIIWAERVGIHQVKGPLLAEVMEKGYPSVKSLSWRIITLFDCYQTSYEQGKIKIIDLSNPENIPDNLSEQMLTCFNQLTIQTIAVIPIFNQAEVWGILWIHHCQSPYFWESWEIDYVTYLGDLLAIACCPALSEQKSS